METQNLWPEFVVEKVRSPKTILKEQAGYLMKMTKNILSADVETTQERSTGQIIHNFYVVAPAMDNYRYRVFNVSHDVIYYPLSVMYRGRFIAVTNEEEFLSVLSEIFKDGDTARIISSLLAQSMAE